MVYTVLTYISASWAVYINKYLASFHQHHGLATLAVSYNTIFPILFAFNFKEQQTICKPRYMKCFQAIFSNTFFLPQLMFFWLGARVWCSHAEETYYFMLNVWAYLSGPKLTDSGLLWFTNCYISICLSACLFVI